MPTKPSPKLADLPTPMLRRVLEVFEAKYPPAIVQNPGHLATQESLMRLAHQSGAHSVVEDLRAAIKAKETP